MTMVVYQGDAPRHVWRRLRDLALSLAGFLLVFVGALAAATTLALVASLVYDAFHPQQANEGRDFLGALVSAAVAGAGLALGRFVVRGRRRTILFLRRFGFGPATRMLTFAVTTAMGRNWRLVTLDDAETRPVGTAAGTKWWTVFGTVAATAAGAKIVWWAVTGGPDRVFTGIFNQMTKDVPGDTAFQAFGRMLAGLFGAVLVGVFVLALILMLAIVIGATVGVSWFSLISIQRAEGARALRVTGPGEIAPMVEKILRRNRNVFAPRLAVAKIDDRVWQDFVAALEVRSAVVVADVSEAGDNLIWEISTLAPDHKPRWIYIGRRDCLAELERASQTADAPARDRRLASLLDGQEVLAYSAEDRRDLRRFTRVLHDRLLNETRGAA